MKEMCENCQEKVAYVAVGDDLERMCVYCYGAWKKGVMDAKEQEEPDEWPPIRSMEKLYCPFCGEVGDRATMEDHGRCVDCHGRCVDCHKKILNGERCPACYAYRHNLDNCYDWEDEDE